MPDLITSCNDPRLAEYRDVANPSALARAGLFVAEGRFVVARLLAQKRFRTRSVLVTATAYEALFGRPEPLLASQPFGLSEDRPLQGQTAPIYIVEQQVMNQVVGFNIHRGCLALAERPSRGTVDDLSFASLRRVLILEGVNNPDNVGGLFRSAAAFGVDVVVLGPECGDPLYRKAIRTSMAATLQVPYVDAGPWPLALERLRGAGLRCLALTPAGDARVIDELPPTIDRVALLLGGEGRGLSPAALAQSDERVRIPIASDVDSLNVTVAASIALHYFRRASVRVS